MLITEKPVIVKGTIKEIFNAIGKATGLKGKSLDIWTMEKASKSEIVNKNIFDLTIMGRESNNPSKPKKSKLKVGKLWIYESRKDNDGKEEWVFKIFENVGRAKEYYKRFKHKEDLTRLLVLFNGESIEVDGLEFDLYEVNYTKGISQYLRTIEEVEADLIRYNNLEDRSIKGTSTIKVFRKGKEIPYLYNTEDNVVEWL